VYWQTNLSKGTDSRFTRMRDEEHLFENLYIQHFLTGRRRKLFLATFNSRGKKIVDFRTADRSLDYARNLPGVSTSETTSAQPGRDLFTVHRDLFARAQSARDIYLSSKQSPTIWNMYSAMAVRLSRRLDPI